VLCAWIGIAWSVRSDAPEYFTGSERRAASTVMRLHDTWLGALLIALAAAFFAYTFTFPSMPGQKYGPALFPRLIALGVMACGLVIAVRGWRSGEPWLRFSPALRQLQGWLGLLAMPLAVVFYLAVAEKLGFLPTAAIVVGSLCFWMGVRWWAAILTGVLAAAVVQWFFGSLMRVPLPRGWFMQLVSGG
jgi:putative tricarboxylic transport membrane protein